MNAAVRVQELAPDLKRKVDERRKQSAEWDKLYGKTTGLSTCPKHHQFTRFGLQIDLLMHFFFFL
jgi:hypothetical protein